MDFGKCERLNSRNPTCAGALIDAVDREIIAWTAVANAGISGSDVRDMMLEAVESGSQQPEPRTL
jgi:hypothetical protein